MGAAELTDHDAVADELRRNQQAFYHVIRNSPFGIYIVNADFVLTQISVGSQKVFASVNPPALGRDFAEVLRSIWCEPFATESIERFRHTLATGEPYVAPSTVERRADIDMVETYDWRIERIGLPDGRDGVVCYFYDLTERQRWNTALRASEERLRLATDAAGLGIWTWQPAADTVVWENDRPYEIMQIPLTETPISATRFAEEFVHPDDLAAFEHAMASTLEHHAPFHFVGRARRTDGKWIWLEFTGKPMLASDGKPLRVIGTIQDITDRKEVEELFKDSDRRKDEFLATLAHELRNPLAPVLNALELMKLAKGDPGLLDQARSTMERQIGQMVRLIDDLLDVSRIRNNKLELKRECTELATLVKHVVEAARPQFARAGHRLTVSLPEAPIYLNADPTRLTQILGNLLNNSCKYTRRGGQISLTATCRESEVTICVKDNGVGIPAEMLPKVFELFTQVDKALDKTEGGLGIGLSLVKRLVEMHDGTVTAHSAGQNQGSEFIVTLPTIEGPAYAATEVRPLCCSQLTDSKRQRFLVVDDNKDAAASLAMLLRFSGNDTRTAHDGLKAIETAQEFRPHVILLDIGLPLRNGYEVCREIRGHDWGKGIKIIALTGWGQAEDRQKSADAGFDVHMVKPVNFAQLQSALSSLSSGGAVEYTTAQGVS